MSISDALCDTPAELRDAVCNNKLIIFTGAGLSFKLKNKQGDEIGVWNNLEQKIIEELSTKGHDARSLIPLLGHVEPIKILNLIECYDPPLPKRIVSDFVKDFFDLADDNDFGLHEKLTKLSKKIITANYDTAFEMAVPEYRKHKAFKGTN